jgi:hypothetical protein
MSLLAPGAPIEEIITYYEIRYMTNAERVKSFLSMDLYEVQKKTSEVLGASNTVRLEFNKIQSTRANFMKELKKAIQCL